ncbi:MAG: hypothetical protein AAGA91_18545 [Pseudomonadota bacterium]
MFAAILIRRLKPGKTYEDFIDAWYPDKGFGVPTHGPDVAINIDDEQEIAAIAYMDLPDRPSLETVLQRVAVQEAERHARIAEVIASTTVQAIYEVKARYDFSSDETVAGTAPDR